MKIACKQFQQKENENYRVSAELRIKVRPVFRQPHIHTRL